MRKNPMGRFGVMRAARMGTLVLCAAALSGCSISGSETSSRQDTELFAMDTYMTLSVWESAEGNTLEDLVREIERVDNLLSAANEDSAIYQWNHRSEESESVDPEVYDLLETCLNYLKDTDGALNLCLYPISESWGFTSSATEHHVFTAEESLEMLSSCDWTKLQLTDTDCVISGDMELQLDLGAVGKGYVTDCCAQVLENNGVNNALLSLGGNVYAKGENPDKKRPWSIAIQDPADPESASYAGVVQVVDRAVVTSGNYQRYFEEDGIRYCHIIDPETGMPCSNGLSSVTIICENGLQADALSTALFVMGLDRGTEYWRSHSDSFECIWIDSEGNQYATEGLKDTYQPMDGFSVEFIVKD